MLLEKIEELLKEVNALTAQNAEEVEQLYKAMGKVFKTLKTWNIYVISSHEETEALLGMKADKKKKIYNGKLKSNFYMFPGPKPPKGSI